MTPAPVPRRIVVIGTGLIGTSAALALRRHGADVWLWDHDPAAVALAADLGAGRALASLENCPAPAADLGAGGWSAPAADLGAGGWSAPADVALIAVPPAEVAGVLATVQRAGLAHCYTDVASVKALPLVQARAAGCDISRYVPGHPLAGRERSGPAAARADLFLGRAWALCPAPETSGAAVATVTAMVTACGAEPVVTDADSHDRWVALVSHAPHVVAAAMAAQLAPESVPPEALSLAGSGLRDATRIAVGDAGLWTQILTGNAGPVAAVLAAVAADIAETARILASGTAGPDGPTGPATPEASKELTGLLEQGRAGVARIPGKRGGPARAFTAVQVVISDRPGELARLFAAAAGAGVNVEDVGIEHSPGAPVGVAELSVRPESAGALISALTAGGWPVRR